MWQNTKTFINTDYYNSEDLNRVNANIQYIAGEVNSIGFVLTLPRPIKTDYLKTDFPTVTAINDMRNNVKEITDSFYAINAPAIIVNAARKQSFDYVEANKLELNLQAIFDILDLIPQSYKYAGTFSAGQNIVL